MPNEGDYPTNGDGGGGGNGRVNPDRKQLAQVILELAAFGQRLTAVAERLYEITGDGKGSEFLAIARILNEDLIPAAKSLVLDLRDRAARKESRP